MEGKDRQGQRAVLAIVGIKRAPRPGKSLPLLQQALAGKLITPTVIRLHMGVLQYRARQAYAAAQTLAALPPGSDEAQLGLMFERR